MSEGYCAEDLSPGMSASFSKTITEADIILFAGVSGDINAVHLDEVYASSTPFGGRIAHGMLSAGLISATLANRLPGPGTIYLGQTLAFRAPVRPGDTVTATVTVKSVVPEKRRVVLETVCRVGDTTVIEGEATVLAPSRPRPAAGQAVI
ncbi:MAG: MaoC family dehydratase [Actinomycetota bacterium]